MAEVVPVDETLDRHSRWRCSLSACLSHPPPSPAPYRAVGQEPGWTLIIDEQDLTFIPRRRPAGPAAEAAGDHRLCRRNLSDAADRREHRPCAVQRRHVRPGISGPGAGRRRRQALRRLRRALGAWRLAALSGRDRPMPTRAAIFVDGKSRTTVNGHERRRPWLQSLQRAMLPAHAVQIRLWL